MATALPESHAISAWLSLVGIPKYQARTAHKTIENNAAESATEASASLLPNDTIDVTVSATEELTTVITVTPKKLKTADIITAFRKERHRVVIQVATAFGASVRPFTNITQRVRITEVSSKGESTKISIIFQS